MIKKLIIRQHNRIQIIGAGLGSFIGIVLLLGIAQFYVEMRSVLQANRDLIDPEFLVINKKVSIMETFNLKQATFSEDEIARIQDQDWAEKVEGFISNQFELSAYTESNRFPDFYTDLFFEAVPDDYIDIKDERWNWNPTQKTIPIILPQDYLNLYNFGFAPSQGLPQISEGTISLVNFTLNIKGRGKTAEFRGKIIGFSNRINSILVPWSFLTWANRNFGTVKENKISRLIVVSNDPTNPAIVKYLDDHNYETIKEKLKSSRLNIILKFVIRFLGSLGVLIIILAFFVFILSFQLLITKSSDKIRRLKWLGYSHKDISKPFIRYFGIIVSIVGLFSAITLFFLKRGFNIYTKNMGIVSFDGYHPYVIFGGILLIVILFILNSFIIYRQTKMIR